jgi:hypothetical protein
MSMFRHVIAGAVLGVDVALWLLVGKLVGV